MKILFGSYSAISVLGGGIKVQMDSLKYQLENLGHEIEIFNPGKDYNLKEFDLFHLFGAHVGTYHFGRAMHSLGMKMVVTPVFYSRRNPNQLRLLTNFAKGLRSFGGVWTEHLFTAELCDRAKIITPNTNQEADLLVKGLKVKEKKIKILPNGVEERFYNADPKPFVDKYKLKDFILYVGHIGWQRKNLLGLIKALARIDHPVVFIGPVLDTDYARICLEEAKKNKNILIISGLHSDSEILASAYAACDVFVLPSFYETPGLAALEAGLAGAKIVITKYGGTDEYFGDYAEYIDPKKVQSIYQGLVRALAKKKDRILAEHIRTNFLWEKSAKKLIEIYTTINVC
ncbi:MAG: glycosyltransferase [candidate division WOR-3 bacterium]|nr:glycosyltransferase [candidate division WOR-3 bacterium]